MSTPQVGNIIRVFVTLNRTGRPGRQGLPLLLSSFETLKTDVDLWPHGGATLRDHDDGVTPLLFAGWVGDVWVRRKVSKSWSRSESPTAGERSPRHTYTTRTSGHPINEELQEGSMSVSISKTRINDVCSPSAPPSLLPCGRRHPLRRTVCPTPLANREAIGRQMWATATSFVLGSVKYCPFGTEIAPHPGPCMSA